MAGRGRLYTSVKVHPKRDISESQQGWGYSTDQSPQSGCTRCERLSWMNDNPRRKVRLFSTIAYVTSALDFKSADIKGQGVVDDDLT
jgi:hypothetical protein